MWTRRVLMNLQLFAKSLDWASFEFDDIFSLLKGAILSNFGFIKEENYLSFSEKNGSSSLVLMIHNHPSMTQHIQLCSLQFMPHSETLSFIVIFLRKYLFACFCFFLQL